MLYVSGLVLDKSWMAPGAFAPTAAKMHSRQHKLMYICPDIRIIAYVGRVVRACFEPPGGQGFNTLCLHYFCKSVAFARSAL